MGKEAICKAVFLNSAQQTNNNNNYSELLCNCSKLVSSRHIQKRCDKIN